MTFDGKQINVSHSVEGKFIEKFECNDIGLESNKEVNKYILSQCTGDYIGDFEFLSVSNKE